MIQTLCSVSSNKWYIRRDIVLFNFSGHLYQALHIFEYLKNHYNSWIPLDPNELDVKFNGPPEEAPDLRCESMKKIYQDAVEDLPSNAPEPRGKEVQTNVYSDSDHTGDKVTRRS